jgi:hypothetical protein
MAAAQPHSQFYAAGGVANSRPYFSGGIERVNTSGFSIGAELGVVTLADPPPPPPYGSIGQDDRQWILSLIIGFHAPRRVLGRPVVRKFEPFVAGGMSLVTDSTGGPGGADGVLAFNGGVGATFWLTRHMGVRTDVKAWMATTECCLGAAQIGMTVRR